MSGQHAAFFGPSPDDRLAAWEQLEAELPVKGKDCPLTAELIRLALGKVEEADGRRLREHVGRCPACKALFEGQKRAAERLRARAVDQSGAPAPRAALHRRFLGVLRKTPKRVLAALVVLAVATAAMGAVSVNLFVKLAALRRELGLDAYISFSFESLDHPSTEPDKARPLFVVGREVVLQGKVLPHLIQEIQLTVTPGLREGQPEWREILPISDGAQGQAVPFETRFTAPADGRLRVVTVRLIPRPAAAAADPRGLREELLTYRVPLACLGAGPIAYARYVQGPGDLRIEREGDRAVVTVRARSYEGSYVTVGSRAAGGTRFLPLDPQRVSHYGEELRFSVLLGAFESYDIQAFALESGQPSDLSDAISNGQFEKVLKGEAKTIRLKEAK